jgi:inhibitor of the pro-sigma K processing machinery
MNNWLVVLAWIAGILIVLVFGKALALPMKIILRLIINGILGGIAILIINFIGSYFGFNISLNVVSALIAGVLGLPGMILLIILKFLL